VQFFFGNIALFMMQNRKGAVVVQVVIPITQKKNWYDKCTEKTV